MRGNNPMFRENCTLSSISQSILNGLVGNLHKLGLIFETIAMRGNNPMFRVKLHIFIISQSILNGLVRNLHKVGVNFSR